MRYLSACAIFKDELPYLYEWLCFHRMVGVEYFYLYDNGSAADHRAAIDAALPEGNYTLIDWPRRPGQYSAYNDGLARARGQTRWLAVLDIDEFLFPPGADDLRVRLVDYERHPALVVNWLLFGASGHADAPRDYVTRAYRRRCQPDLVVGREFFQIDPVLDPEDPNSYYPQCGHYKSIVDPQRVTHCFNAHSFFPVGPDLAVNEAGEEVRTMLTRGVTVARFRINHYWSRALADLRRKQARGRVADDKFDDLDYCLAFEQQLNTVEDTTIQPLAARLPPLPAFW